MEKKSFKKQKRKKLPKILIVGGAGYIGSILCKKLLKEITQSKLLIKFCTIKMF